VYCTTRRGSCMNLGSYQAGERAALLND
jgi:hypothetical protein